MGSSRAGSRYGAGRDTSLSRGARERGAVTPAPAERRGGWWGGARSGGPEVAAKRPKAKRRWRRRSDRRGPQAKCAKRWRRGQGRSEAERRASLATGAGAEAETARRSKRAGCRRQEAGEKIGRICQVLDRCCSERRLRRAQSSRRSRWSGGTSEGSVPAVLCPRSRASVASVGSGVGALRQGSGQAIGAELQGAVGRRRPSAMSTVSTCLSETK
jgi:hypothetical protein